MSAKAIQRVPILRGQGSTAECLVKEVGLQELRVWQRVVHTSHIAPDPTRLDRRWNWPNLFMGSYIVNEPRGRRTEAFQLLVPSSTGRAVPIGQALLVSGYPHPGQLTQSTTFVWFLTSTPQASLQAMGVTSQFVVLPLLLDTAIQVSKGFGLSGRIALHADSSGTRAQRDDLIKRYSRCGLTLVLRVQGTSLSFFRRMDDRYFVHTEASAIAEAKKWDYLR